MDVKCGNLVFDDFLLKITQWLKTMLSWKLKTVLLSADPDADYEAILKADALPDKMTALINYIYVTANKP